VTRTTPAETFPMVFEVDFGTGCTHNGITRSGMLIVTLSNYMLATGSVLTIERSNYFVDGYGVAGTVTYTNQTSGEVPQWTRTLANGSITNPEGDVFTHSGTQTVRHDNTFEITAGNHTVTRPNGTTLSAAVTVPLIKHAECSSISAGVVHLEGTFLNGDLDYGDDTCDNIATYTHADGTVHTVQLN
jgi:hypothetical protein